MATTERETNGKSFDLGLINGKYVTVETRRERKRKSINRGQRGSCMIYFRVTIIENTWNNTDCFDLEWFTRAHVVYWHCFIDRTNILMTN